MRDEIKSALNGVGRIIQYFNQFEPEPTNKFNLNDPKQNFVWSIFEGQMEEGIAGGFARILYGDTGKSYLGYYKQGVKSGKGIQYYSSGNVQAEGYWKDNGSLLKSIPILSLSENINM